MAIDSHYIYTRKTASDNDNNDRETARVWFDIEMRAKLKAVYADLKAAGVDRYDANH